MLRTNDLFKRKMIMMLLTRCCVLHPSPGCRSPRRPRGSAGEGAGSLPCSPCSKWYLWVSWWRGRKSTVLTLFQKGFVGQLVEGQEVYRAHPVANGICGSAGGGAGSLPCSPYCKRDLCLH